MKKTGIIHYNGNYSLWDEKEQSLGNNNFIMLICKQLEEDGHNPEDFTFETFGRGRVLFIKPFKTSIGTWNYEITEEP